MRTAFMVVITIVLVTGSAQAQVVPDRMNYQGVLADASGVPVTSGNYVLEFRVYDQAAEGAVVWGPQVFDGASATGHAALVSVVDGAFVDRAMASASGSGLWNRNPWATR